MSDARALVGSKERKQFEADGLVLIRGFYDVDRDLAPIWAGIAGVIDLVAREAGVAVPDGSGTADDFDTAYGALIRADRSLGGTVYDGVKQIASFVRLVSSSAHEQAYRALRDTDLVGVAAGGFGIRIDNPNESRFKAQWHQEHPAQGRSLDGCVFWSPLVPVTRDIGPVEVCVGSHVNGLLDIDTHETDGRSGAYATYLAGEADVVSQYPQRSMTMAPGDLLIIDFLTVHRSGTNVAARSRWTMQSRLFNFREPTGVRCGWAGGVAPTTRGAVS